MIRVLLGQRGTLFLGALAAVLSSQPDLLVVAELTDVDLVVDTALHQRPRVAVLDGGLPGTTTIVRACRELRESLPECRPLVMLDRTYGAGLSRSLVPLAPWLGLLATDATTAELVTAVRLVAGGEPAVDPGLAAAARQATANPLTEREREVLQLTRSGAPTKEIAKRLDLRVGTVRNYLSRGLAKTGARTPLEAIRIAHHAGWI